MRVDHSSVSDVNLHTQTGIAGNLKQFMDDQYIADVRKGMQGLKGKPYALCRSRAVGEPVGSRGWPSPQVLERCRALGRTLGEAVLQ